MDCRLSILLSILLLGQELILEFRLLFFQLLSKPKFSSVEKIKTIGSTYMAAAGLTVTAGDEKKVGSK